MTKKLRKEKWRINVCMETTQQSLHFYSNHQTQLSLDLLIESLGASPDGFQSIKGDKSLDWAFFLLLCCFSVCTNVYVCARTSGLLSQAIHQAIWSLCWLIIMGFWGWPSAKYARVCPHTYCTRCKHSEKTERLTEIQMGKSCIEKKTQLAGRKRGQADKNKEKKRRKENNLWFISTSADWWIIKGKETEKKKLRVDWYIYTARKKMW